MTVQRGRILPRARTDLLTVLTAVAVLLSTTAAVQPAHAATAARADVGPLSAHAGWTGPGSPPAGATATALQIEGFASCPPPAGTPKDGDVNGGVDDWKLDEQEHDNGRLELWCVDGNPQYYALVWVDDEGDRHFIGKCPFGGGLNDADKVVDGNGNLTKSVWTSDDGGADDDGDGAVDDAIYEYYPGNGTLVVKHSEDGAIVGNDTRNLTPPDGDSFDFDDLAPEHPGDDDFWAVAEQPPKKFAGEMRLTERRTATVVVRNETTREPIAGRTVTVRDLDGEAVATLTTADDGTAATELSPGEYVLDVAGAPPRLLDLTVYSTTVTVLAGPVATERVGRLAARIDELERDNEALREEVAALEAEVAALREAANRTPETGGDGIPGFGPLAAVVALLAAVAALAGRASVGQRRR